MEGCSLKPSATQMLSFPLSSPPSLGCRLWSSCDLMAAEWLLYLLAARLWSRQGEGRRKSVCVGGIEKVSQKPPLVSICVLPARPDHSPPPPRRITVHSAGGDFAST